MSRPPTLGVEDELAESIRGDSFMNMVDIVIIGFMLIVVVSGFKFGILAPVSKVGGLVIGLLLAVQYHDQLAFALTEQIEGETARRIAAFAAIFLGTFVVARIVASFIKKALSLLMLGWADGVAGAVVGFALGAVTLGTVIYLLTGMAPAQVRAMVNESQLAPSVAQASLVSSSAPWCSQAGADADDCVMVVAAMVAMATTMMMMSPRNKHGAC